MLIPSLHAIKCSYVGMYLERLTDAKHDDNGDEDLGDCEVPLLLLLLVVLGVMMDGTAQACLELLALFQGFVDLRVEEDEEEEGEQYHHDRVRTEHVVSR